MRASVSSIQKLLEPDLTGKRISFLGRSHEALEQKPNRLRIDKASQNSASKSPHLKKTLVTSGTGNIPAVLLRSSRKSGVGQNRCLTRRYSGEN